MKLKILREAYTKDVVDSYLKDVYNAYDRLRDCLYALNHAVDGETELENSVDSILYELEDGFYEYMKSHLDDIENALNYSNGEEEVEVEESLKESYAEDKLLKELQIFKKVDPTKDKIQIRITPKGNYEICVNDKELGILDKKVFSENDVEELKLNGYFDDFFLNEEFTVGEIYSNGKVKFKVLEPTKDGKLQIQFNDKNKTVKTGTNQGLINMIKKNNYVKEKAKSIKEAVAPKGRLVDILEKSKTDIINAMPMILKSAGYDCEQVTNDSFEIFSAPSDFKTQDIIRDIKLICDLAGVKYELDGKSLIFNDGSTLVDVYPNTSFIVDCKWIE